MSRRIILLLCCSLSAWAQDTLRLTLAEAERMAFANNPAIRSAEFVARAVGQTPAENRAAELPTITGLVTGVSADNGTRLAAGALNNPTVYSRFASGIAINQLITDFGRTRNLVQTAKFRALSQQQVTEAVREDVLLATDRAYFAVLRAQSLLKVAEETVNTRQLVSNQVTQLAAASLKSELDVSFANVNLEDAKLQLAQAQNDVSSTQAQLAAAIGFTNQPAFVLTDEPMPDGLPAKADPLIVEALQKRPELLQRRLDVNAAERFLEAERALSRPNVAIIAAAGGVPAAPSQVAPEYGAAGVNVSIPIFNGGLFRARRSEAEFRLQAADKDVRDLETRVARDVRVAYLNAQTAFQRVGLTEQLLKQAQLGLNLAKSRYDLGLSSIVELSQAQLNYTSAEIATASARFDYQTERSVLRFATGQL